MNNGKYIPNDHDLYRIYDVLRSDGRKHYILFDRCRGFDYRYPEWCDYLGRYNSYPYCNVARQIPWKILNTAIGSDQLFAGMCRSVLYPGACAGCMYRIEYNISPIIKAKQLFIKKDHAKIILGGGMVFQCSK